MEDLSETSVAQNRNMATDRAQGQNLGTRPKLGHYVRLQGGENIKFEENGNGSEETFEETTNVIYLKNF